MKDILENSGENANIAHSSQAPILVPFDWSTILSHRMHDLFQLLLPVGGQPYPIQRYSLLADSSHLFLEVITMDR
jgi:hypothetical protein